MKKIRLFLIPILALSFASVNGQSKIYVDSDIANSGDGTSWATPYQSLQTAIDSAKANDTIWVKRGVYKPSKPLGGASTLNPRQNTFQLKSDVSIYGGFQGTESSLNQRMISLVDSNMTILSGDLGVANDSIDNAYHVAIGVEVVNVILNGLSFQDGNANDTISDSIGIRDLKRSYGGGLFLDTASSITLEYVKFKNNNAAEGGAGLNIESSNSIVIHNAIFDSNIIDSRHITGGTDDGGAGIRNYNASPAIVNAEFMENKCYDCQGGGAMRNINSNTTIDSSSFTKNFVDAGDGGGAVYNIDSDPIFTTVSFDNNSTEQEAGAVYNDSSNPTFTDVSFTSNSSKSGGAGAMENDAGTAVFNNVIFSNNSTLGDGGAIQNWKSDITLTDVIFENNHAAGDGGALLNYSNSSPTMNRVTFKGNSADGNGGAIHNSRDVEAIITNTLIYDNHAGGKGGGIFTEVYTNWEGSSPSSVILTNVTITKNRADSSGGGAFDDGTGSSQLRNSIIHGNYAPTNEDVDAPLSMALTSVHFSIIENEFHVGGGNYTTFTDPVFLDTLNNDFRLHNLSPALDAGDSSFYNASLSPDLSAITTDIRGANRIMGDSIDLGAYEMCDIIDTSSVQLSMNNSSPTGNDTIVFIATPTNGGSNPVYTWYKNDVEITEENKDEYTAVAGIDVINGDKISVSVSTEEACTIDQGITDSIIIVIVGIKEVQSVVSALNIYPNPNSGSFNLSYLSDVKGLISYTITDITGREIYREEGQSSNAHFEKAFNLNLSNGLYIFTIINDKGEKENLKFIVNQ